MLKNYKNFKEEIVIDLPKELKYYIIGYMKAER